MCEGRLHVQGASEKHVHGHRARSQQRKAAKELRKTSKWAVRELHSLEGLRQRFTQDAQEALRLERWLPTHPARQGLLLDWILLGCPRFSLDTPHSHFGGTSGTEATLFKPDTCGRLFCKVQVGKHPGRCAGSAV